MQNQANQTQPIVGCFGGGLDSTTLVEIDLDRDRAASLMQISRELLDRVFPSPDLWIFSDTGAEHAHTYKQVADIAARLGDRFVQVAKNGESILEWNLRLGTVPVMPGGSHTCSLKYKGEVMEGYVAERFGCDVTWIIGIEADEEGRAKRFTKPKGNGHTYLYPLMDLELTRQGCATLLGLMGAFVPEKSSCVYCPFKSVEELRWMFHNDQAAWELCVRVEDAFQAASAYKHQAWIDAGKPLSQGKRPRAPRGMWRLDSFAEGARLFAKRIDGKQLSVREWGERFAREDAQLISVVEVA